MIEVLFALFILLQVADAAITNAALKLPNIKEVNPVAKAVMDKIGVIPALLLLKGAIIALFWYYLDVIDYRALMVLNVIYIYVVYRNTTVLNANK